MTAIHPGRFTAEHKGGFVVFLIGMRINKLWKVWKWLPVAQAMGPMIRELHADPSSGFLGATFGSMGLRSPLIVQYWRSFEALEAYATDRSRQHLPAWQAFRKAVGDGGDVGIWHETYAVEEGAWEAVYGNMPVMGLAAATSHVPVDGATHTARKRMMASAGKAG